jgi:murein DD-endopeptidase MepM/ murein hydrolase activator NlpD
MLAAVASAALALGMVSVPLAHADDHLKHRQHQVQGQIKHAQGDLDETSRAYRQATARLQAAEAQYAAARRHASQLKTKLQAARILDQQLRQALADAQARLDQARADLVAGEQDVTDQRAAVTNVITSIYEQGDPTLMAISSMLQADTTTDLTWSAEGQSTIVDRQTRAYQQLTAAQVLLQVREERVASAERDVASKQKQAAAHLIVVRDLHAQAKAARVEVHKVVKERRHARQAAHRAKARDRSQLAHLRKQENHIRALIRAAAARAARSHGGYHGHTGGFLMRPVANSYITSPYGWRVHPIYHYWGLHDGDDFHAPCGTPLHASGAGTVISTYYSSVWGNRLYLYLGQVNGQSVTVIYNHLSRYAVSRGARVGRGQVIGYAGTTGWSTACHLHFTVMVNGRAVNPVNWF